MDTRRITLLSFSDQSFDLAAEDNSGVSVSQSTGLVSLEPGKDSLPPWCLSPDNIIGFESTEHSEKPGRSIFLEFETDYRERHRLYLGTTSNTGNAEGWVSRVNSLYPRSGSLARPGNITLARRAPLSGTPFLDESIKTGKVTWIPGIYGNMIPRSGKYVPPKPYEPLWMRKFAERALQHAGEVTGHPRTLHLERSSSPGIDTDALMFTLDLVKPHALRENQTNPSRAVLSGELLFEERHNRPGLKILRFAEVTHLALLTRRNSLFSKAVGRRELGVGAAERDASLAEWLTLAVQRRKRSRKIPIVTHEKEVSHFHLMNTLFDLKSKEDSFLRYPAGSMESMAELLHRFESDDALLVCDIGTANEFLMYYDDRYRGIRERFQQFQPRYIQPVKAGLGLTAEDPLWFEICSQAFSDTIEHDSEAIRTSLEQTKKRVETHLGMRWCAAA